MALVRRKMVMYAGLVLLCLSGFAAAGEEPLGPIQFHDQPQWENAQGVTTVCIQVRGPYGQALCGPMVSKTDGKDEIVRSAGPSDPPGHIQQDQHRSAQSENWLGPQLNPGVPLRSAVLEGFIGNGPVYQMGPGRAMETLPPLVKVNSFAPPPPMALVRAPEQPPHQPGPFMEHGMRLSGPPPQVMMAPPPEMAPHFQNQGPQLRTFPFAPFGIEQSAGPQHQFQMRQAVGSRASNSQFMPAMRSADCPDNFKQPAIPVMRATPSFSDSPQKQRDAKELSKQCEEQQLEIKQKRDEISELKKQLENMSQSAKASSMSVEQKTASMKSSLDKDFDDVKQKSEGSEKKKKK